MTVMTLRDGTTTVAGGRPGQTAENINPQTVTGGVSDPLAGLSGANRDVAAALMALFKTYGLETLAPQIIKMVQQGMGSDAISLELQNTKEYKERFAANDARLKAGLPVLTPAEYIATERAYRQVMSAAGLPPGFYDQPDDFQKFLAADVSPTEVQGRVQAASEAIFNAPSETVAYFKQFYNTGDMIAYALDPKRAMPLINERIKAAEAAALAAQNGVSGLSQGAAESIGQTGASLDQMRQGLSFIGQEQVNAQRLGQIYGDSVTADTLAAEVFQQDAGATAKRRTLASKERATFGGSNSLTQGSLSRSDAGSV